MSDFSRYLIANREVEVAIQQNNYAGQRLENARIKERMAEVISQSEPLNTFLKSLNLEVGMEKRALVRLEIIKIIEYVVIGKKVN